MLANVFEVLMLFCFAMAWPAALCKSWTAGTRKGKSLLFLIVVFIGYLCGIAKVVFSEDSRYLLLPYMFNGTLIFCDLLLYYRNYRLDEGKFVPDFLQVSA